jgi:hypothetical protein
MRREENKGVREEKGRMRAASPFLFPILPASHKQLNGKREYINKQFSISFYTSGPFGIRTKKSFAFY